MSELSADTLFSVQNLSWQANSFPVLDDLSFEVARGEYIGLIGPNGAGKSSLLRCLYQKITDYQGSIRFQNLDIKKLSRREFAKQVAVVLQEPPSLFDLSVADVIGMGLTPHKKLLEFDNVQDTLDVIAAAKKVDMADYLERPFQSLSGGEKQRVIIARAIVQKPLSLLLDEPTNHLDIRHQIDVLRLVKKIQTTVLVSIHDLNLAAYFCDRLILLDRGKVIAQGTPEQVLTEQNIKKVFGVSASIALDDSQVKVSYQMTPDQEEEP